MPKTSVSNVFLKLSRIIESGANTDMVMDKLNEIDQCNIHNKELEKFIIKISCDAYQVTPSQIQTSKWLQKDKITARNMCIILIYNFIPEYSNETIGNLFYKNYSLVSRVVSNFNKMSVKIKHERLFLQQYEKLKEKVEAHINN